MKKRKIPNNIVSPVANNPVAKFACRFNKSHTFDNKKTYRRKAKHVKQDVSPIVSIGLILLVKRLDLSDTYRGLAKVSVFALTVLNVISLRFFAGILG